MAEYHYEPLGQNQIRLMKLLPGLPGEELKCVLEHVELLSASDHRQKCTCGLFPGDRSNRHRHYGNVPTDRDQRSVGNKYSGISERSNGDEYSHGDKVVNDESNYQNPLYEALSYVWGHQDPHGILHIVGNNSGILAIGPNLCDAIKRLRPEPGHKARILWVDQICINQRNLEERGAQVQRMRDIYKSARKVLIWLGEEDEHTALGIQFARRLYELIKSGILPDGQYLYGDQNIFDLAHEFAEQLPREYIEYHMDCFGYAEPRLLAEGILYWCMSAMYKLSYKSWFERSWTFQEVVLAQDAEVICGGHSVPWNIIERTFDLPVTTRNAIQYPPSHERLELEKFSKLSRFVTQGRYAHFQSFTRLLVFRRQSKCHDLRDKVIALLGLVDNIVLDYKDQEFVCTSHCIQPNYTESAGDLYARTAKYLIRTEGRLTLLWHIDFGSTQADAPSWVPDWTPSNIEAVTPFLLKTSQASMSSRHPNWLRRIIGDGNFNELQVATIEQDTIKCLREYDQSFNANFFRQSTPSNTYQFTSQPLHIAVKQTMVRERWGKSTHAARAAFFRLHTSNDDFEFEFQNEDPVEKQVEALYELMNDRDPAYKMFYGQNGTIGYGPNSLQTGDEIHLLLGFNALVALRPVDSRYRLTGHNLVIIQEAVTPMTFRWRIGKHAFYSE
ncbi:heterokaryon incompatibility protein-domain-containing protein [Phaeosphaeria sp. MPI-PUGE-AT-0046c]|nr:heterokaryon incompatibility protein-domain-containing protein [Phaeosphaeria sp. MPI-PUGE-AT-0046c]